jgi:hypothetical protein
MTAGVHVYEHVQDHISGAFRPGLVPSGTAGDGGLPEAGDVRITVTADVRVTADGDRRVIA